MANQPGKAAGFSLPCRYRKIITFMRYLKRPFRSIEGSPIPYRLIIRDLRTNQGKYPDKKSLLGDCYIAGRFIILQCAEVCSCFLCILFLIGRGGFFSRILTPDRGEPAFVFLHNYTSISLSIDRQSMMKYLLSFTSIISTH